MWRWIFPPTHRLSGLPLFRTRWHRHHSLRQLMSTGNRPSFSKEAKLPWAGSREITSPFQSRRTVFLTSLVIELIDSRDCALFAVPLAIPACTLPARVRIGGGGNLPSPHTGPSTLRGSRRISHHQEEVYIHLTPRRAVLPPIPSREFPRGGHPDVQRCEPKGMLSSVMVREWLGV
jgi:hypothetical protein